jgi:hypothetical protein
MRYYQRDTIDTILSIQYYQLLYETVGFFTEIFYGNFYGFAEIFCGNFYGFAEIFYGTFYGFAGIFCRFAISLFYVLLFFCARRVFRVCSIRNL